MLAKKQSIFTVDEFVYPNDYTFPGQGELEEVVFVTREDRKSLTYRRGIIIFVALLIVALGSILPFEEVKSLLTGVAAFEMFIGWFCISFLWRRNLVIVTDERIIQFVNKTILLKKSIILLPNEISGFEIKKDSLFNKQFNLDTLVIKSKVKNKPDILVKNTPEAKEIKKFLEVGVE